MNKNCDQCLQWWARLRLLNDSSEKEFLQDLTDEDFKTCCFDRSVELFHVACKKFSVECISTILQKVYKSQFMKSIIDHNRDDVLKLLKSE